MTQRLSPCGWPAAAFLCGGPITKILMLTGQRRGEVGGMTWDELDLDKALWSLPASRTKNRKTHEVPLSDAAVAVIREMPRHGPYVFTTGGVRPIGNYGRGKAAIDQAFDQDLPRWTFHDLRRTAVSGMARLGIPLAVIEKVVNHTSGSFAGIVGVYQRHSFADEKRNALEAWSRFVLSLQQPAENVVRLRAAP